MEPYYAPFIGLLPEKMQVVLLDESSFGGFTMASCVLAVAATFLALLAWFAVAKYMQKSTENTSTLLNEQLLALKLSLNQSNLKTSIFEQEIGELQSRLKESEAKLFEANDRLESISALSSINTKEEERLRQSEAQAIKELSSVKLELAETLNKFERQRSEYETQTTELTRQVTDLTGQLECNEKLLSEIRIEEEKLRDDLAAARNLLKAQQNQQYSSIPIGIDGLSNETIAKFVETEQRIAESEKKLTTKTNECNQLTSRLNELDKKYQDLEKQLRESEMQVKILNDLREKDTKQHVKCKLFLFIAY